MSIKIHHSDDEYFETLECTFQTMTKKTSDDELIDTNEAAERLKISRRHAWSLIKSGLLPAQRVGRTYVIKASDLEAVRDRPKVGRPTKKATKK